MGKKKITISKIKQDRIRQVSLIIKSTLKLVPKSLLLVVYLLSMLTTHNSVFLESCFVSNFAFFDLVIDYLLQAQEGSAKESHGAFTALRRQGILVSIRQELRQQATSLLVGDRGRLCELSVQRLLQSQKLLLQPECK